MSKKYSSTFITRNSRDLGLKPVIGEAANLHKSLASNIKVHHTWLPRNTVKDSDHGGVFNFDFSRNGSLLGVACERKSVLLFDPFNGQMVAAKTNAHTDCVNCVKFLDDRLFATCSDDTNVALWDARYLKHHVQVFHGHTNWVKNIEYDSNQGMLLTSGFDGCIYTWNINRYSNEESSNKVFSTSGLMRSKLSPDFTKLLISTHEGYIIVIHNLDLTTIAEDLKGFKPNMYHLMQRSQTPLRIGLIYNHVFEQERNRVEFINDWPAGNDANIVSSIQVHPQGWCVLSRNTDSSEKAEWTCVHDIQDYHTEKKPAPHPWELDSVTPHTSAAHSKSTNTPAFSSVAPSHLRGTTQHNNESVQNNSSRQLRSSSMSSSNRLTRNSPDSIVQDSNLDTQSLDENQQTSEEFIVHSEREPSQQEHITSNEGEPSSQEEVTSGEREQSGSQEEGNRGEEQSTSQENGNSRTVQVSGGGLHVLSAGTGLNNLYVRPEASGQDMPVHDSLIQIRRGARNSDGQFSFSISVHTASGRTIEFNQDDLDSSDDDEFVVEQIVSSSNGSGSQNITVVRQQDHSNERNQHANLNAIQNGTGERYISNRIEVDSDDENNDIVNQRDYDSVDILNREEHFDNITVNGDTDDNYADNADQNDLNDNHSNNVDQSDRDDSYNDDVNESDENEDVNGCDIDNIVTEGSATSGPAAVGGDGPVVDIDVSLDDDSWTNVTVDNAVQEREEYDPNEDDYDILAEEYEPLSDDSDGENESNNINRNLFGEQLYQRAMQLDTDELHGISRTLHARQNNNSRQGAADRNTRDGRGNDSEEEETRNVDDPGSPASGNRLLDQSNERPPPASAASLQPRTNTLMFVVQSNSGDRRRRYFNLSYMDSYTERENSVLQKKIHSNRKRLLGYMEECNVGRGFIKEVAFSADGRLISSPFGFGLRIFAFDSDCNELCDYVPSTPVKLYEVTCSLAHVNCVVATKFSPTYNLVVSGCLDGKIAFHQPIL